MVVRVVDASALGALVFGESMAEKIAHKLENAIMAAPALLWFEMASICLRKIKSHPNLSDQILRVFNIVGSLDIKIVDVDHATVVEMAKDTGLTTYDACYLWLARHLQGELITLDKKLRKTARIVLAY